MNSEQAQIDAAGKTGGNDVARPVAKPVARPVARTAGKNGNGGARSKLKIQSFLAQLPLFSAMAADQLDYIAQGTTESHVESGTLIFQRGDACAGFHCVVFGQVKLSFVSAQGMEKVIELIGPSHSFGEALMFMEQPYIVSAQAMADSLLLHISKQTVFTLLERDPTFARKMLAGLSRRMHGLIGDLESFSLRSGAQRVIAYLLAGALQANSRNIVLPVGKAVIASRLNLTPEYFSRIMGDLVAQGLITVKGREIALLDAEKLRQYAG